MVLADGLFHHMVGLLNIVNGGFEVADLVKNLEVLWGYWGLEEVGDGSYTAFIALGLASELEM